ncbi:MAG: SUMF1/EgtB/PvdO family nonheme iron enzyme, partial [Nitrospirota bacterium]|nr:SUMF1/EgtB/PvdO family nonheme iron enzyme [Nitrospirota bacterium]
MRWFQRQIFRSMGIMVGMVSAVSLSFAIELDVLKAGVVKITTKTGQVGTGFIVRVEPEMLYIITAAHVIAGDPRPSIDFFSKDLIPGGQGPVKGMVLPGAQVSDDLRGLAVVIVRGKDQRPSVVTGLVFESSAQLVSGGEQALVIGHPGGGGDWAVVKRNISNRVVHDITLDPGVASRFSGGPILVDGKVVGMVMTNRGEFGLGITHKNLLNYLDGIGIEPQATDGRALGGFVIKPEEPSRLPNNHRLNRGPGGFIVEEPPQSSSKALPSSMTGKDGTPMVLVPAGEFTMGSRGDDTKARDNERPAHQVYLDAYYIDQYEVTVKPYQRFIEENNRTAPKHWEQMDMRRDAQKPVVGIDWYDAYAYCRWARKRLPTEAEWEKAARGTDKRTYPWGEFTPNSSTANFGKGSLDVKNVYAERLKDVGSYEGGKSPYGAYDMAGNAEEWVQDWYGEDYYQSSPRENPSGPRD